MEKSPMYSLLLLICMANLAIMQAAKNDDSTANLLYISSDVNDYDNDAGNGFVAMEDTVNRNDLMREMDAPIKPGRDFKPLRVGRKRSYDNEDGDGFASRNDLMREMNAPIKPGRDFKPLRVGRKRSYDNEDGDGFASRNDLMREMNAPIKPGRDFKPLRVGRKRNSYVEDRSKK